MLTATVTDRVTEPNLDTCSAMAAPPTQWIRSAQSTLPVFLGPLTGPPSSDTRYSRPWQGTPRPHPGHQCHAPKPTNMRAANLPPRFGTVTAWDPTASLKQSRFWYRLLNLHPGTIWASSLLQHPQVTPARTQLFNSQHSRRLTLLSTGDARESSRLQQCL